jgi:RecB family endonuclease NucS
MSGTGTPLPGTYRVRTRYVPGTGSCPKGTVRLRAVRLLVARCEIRYTGRLNAVLPAATRLLIFKADGSVLVHADAGGYKPLNCN